MNGPSGVLTAWDGAAVLIEELGAETSEPNAELPRSASDVGVPRSVRAEFMALVTERQGAPNATIRYHGVPLRFPFRTSLLYGTFHSFG